MAYQDLLKPVALLLVLLNPFFLAIYLADLIRRLEAPVFRRVLCRAGAIAAAVFCLFAIAGDAIFDTLLQVRFASFLIFGGVIFAAISVRYVWSGSVALEELHGSPDQLAGTIAMPFMIGPGTVSASVLAGAKLPPAWAIVSIVGSLAAVVTGVIALKWLHHTVASRHEQVLERYIDIVGRISALVMGTIAVDMVLRGIELWQGLTPG